MATTLVFSDAFFASAGALSAKSRRWLGVDVCLFCPVSLNLDNKRTQEVVSNPARKDDLKLKQWVREDELGQLALAVPKATFSVAVYTDEEYSAHLQSPDWTKQETDRLFELCQTFHLKFIVIADRYESEEGEKTRTVEDLKERYFDVAGKLQVARSGPHAQYPTNRDLERKKNLLALKSRPPEVIKEEQQLFHELKRRELHERKWASERDYLVFLEARGLPLIILEKRKGLRMEVLRKRKDGRLLFPKIVPDASCHKEYSCVVTSSCFLGPSNHQAKFKELLDEYNIGNPPSLPNMTVCDVADEVRGNVMALLEIKKTIERNRS
ncbi:hypothetical protein BDR26DRAFT_928987 [Obelidium mucronatum]|nr:hypothetical protein BDR26DRAFT_928987 [Obelidium mucronatum]